MSKILSVNNLTVHFHTEAGIVRALEDVSFSIEEGEVLGLVGETGCGKSVTALSVMGLVPVLSERSSANHRIRGQEPSVT